MLTLIKEQRKMIEDTFIKVKQEAMIENEEEPNDGNEA